MRWIPGWIRKGIAAAIESEVDRIDTDDVERFKRLVKEKIRRVLRV